MLQTTVPQDWRALAKFCDSHYVRHLVDENGDFEMIVSVLGCTGTLTSRLPWATADHRFTATLGDAVSAALLPFSVQLICWKKGQASRVHNHAQVPGVCWQSSDSMC